MATKGIVINPLKQAVGKKTQLFAATIGSNAYFKFTGEVAGSDIKKNVIIAENGTPAECEVIQIIYDGIYNVRAAVYDTGVHYWNVQLESSASGSLTKTSLSSNSLEPGQSFFTTIVLVNGDKIGLINNSPGDLTTVSVADNVFLSVVRESQNP